MSPSAGTSRDLPAIEGGTPVRTDYLVFGSPRIEEAEIQEVVATLRSGWIGTGPKAAAFEAKFRDYVGSRYACAVNSCTAAIHLSILAAGLGPGDEVITTPLTFPATANAVVHAGATPVFVDVEPDSMNLAAGRIEERLTPRTRCILPVHFAGRACDMRVLMDIADHHDLVVVEDCAHAVETRYRGRNAGTFGGFGCFSFYVTKNVVTGEGGMVVTDDRERADRVRVLSLHGMTADAWARYRDEGYRHYLVTEAGFKYNLTDLQASLGLHQLDRVEANHAHRARIWMRYQQAFAGLPCRLPPPPGDGDRHAHHLYTLLLDLEALRIDRDGFLQAMHAERIGTGVHFVPVHLHPYYRRKLGNQEGTCPVAEDIGRRTVSLPLSAKLTDRDADDVIRAVTRILSHYLR